MTEQWRTIPGYEGSYEVSDQGRVRSVDRVVHCAASKHHPNGRIRRFPGRLLKGDRDKDGYIHVLLHCAPSKERKAVHQLVLEAFVGPCPPGQECRHLDGKRARNALDNLCWGTPAENGQDRADHNSMPRGEGHHKARLRVIDVLEIRASEERGVDLSSRFGVSAAQISSIRKRKTWAWL